MEFRTPTIVGTVLFNIEEDSFECQTSVVVHDHALWLVATWFELPATGEKWPDRIVPLAQFPQTAQQISPIRLKVPIPKALLYVDCPQSILDRYLAQTHPCVFEFPTLGGTQ